MKNNFKKLLKCKVGTVLTEALISMCIISILFVSISTAITAATANARRLQEVNETSTYAQKIIDCIYSIAKSDSEAFFTEVKKVKTQYDNEQKNGAPYQECAIDLYGIMNLLEQSSETSIDPNDIITLQDLLQFESGANDNIASEAQEYAVSLYLLPSYKASEGIAIQSVNYFISYNPHFSSTETGGRSYNTGLLPNVYTFKIVVSKTVQNYGNALTNYTQNSPASVTYIFQIAVDGGA